MPTMIDDWTEHSLSRELNDLWDATERIKALRHPNPESWQSRERNEAALEMVERVRDLIDAVLGDHLELRTEKESMRSDEAEQRKGYRQALDDIERLASELSDAA